LKSAVLLLLLLAACGKQEEATQSAPATTTDAQSVSMPEKTARQNGIVVAALQEVAAQTAVPVGNASVVDLTDLVSSASQYAAANAQREQAAARVQASLAELARLRALNADNKNVSDKAVQDQAATAAGDEANVHAAEVSAIAAEAAARQRWGALLAGGFVHGAPWARQLAARELVLLEVAFTMPIAPPPAIRVAGASGQQVAARHLAPSPRVDARLLKPSQFYLAPGGDLPVGLVSAVSAPVAARGVLLPEPAVVWNGAQALVFVEDRPGHYVEHPVSASRPVPGGFLEQTLAAGQRVVVSGAQQLLSEQHKPEAE
jgi:hypothetical protein